MACNFKIAHSKLILGKTGLYKIHGSRDDEERERESVLTSFNDTGRWKFPINKLNNLVVLLKRPAAGQRRTAIQKSPRRSPLPPDEYKAVRWEGGDRRKTSSSKQGEKRWCCGECGCPP